MAKKKAHISIKKNSQKKPQEAKSAPSVDTVMGTEEELGEVPLVNLQLFMSNAKSAGESTCFPCAVNGTVTPLPKKLHFCDGHEYILMRKAGKAYRNTKTKREKESAHKKARKALEREYEHIIATSHNQILAEEQYVVLLDPQLIVGHNGLHPRTVSNLYWMLRKTTLRYMLLIEDSCREYMCLMHGTCPVCYKKAQKGRSYCSNDECRGTHDSRKHRRKKELKKRAKIYKKDWDELEKRFSKAHAFSIPELKHLPSFSRWRKLGSARREILEAAGYVSAKDGDRYRVVKK
jgi:hypothetical protein